MAHRSSTEINFTAVAVIALVVLSCSLAEVRANPTNAEPCTDVKHPAVPPNQRDVFKRTVEGTIAADGHYCTNTSNYVAEFFCYVCIRHPRGTYLDCFKMCTRDDKDECSWRCAVRPVGYNDSYLTLLHEIQQETTPPPKISTTPLKIRTTTLKIPTAAPTSPTATLHCTPQVKVKYVVHPGAIGAIVILAVGLFCTILTTIYYRRISQETEKGRHTEEEGAQFISSSATVNLTGANCNLAASRDSIDSDKSELTHA